MVADLLSAALADLEQGLPSFPGKFFVEDEEGQPLFEATGPGERFRSLTNRHYLELEKELGNESPTPFFAGALLVRKEEK